MRSVFAVCDQEYDYAYKLMEYLHRMQSLPFEVQVFTSMEKLTAFLEKQPAALLLLSEQLAERLPQDPEELGRCGKVIILKDGSGMYAGSGLPAVSKYQSAGNLLREVMDCYGAEQAASRAESFRSGAAELTGILSVSDDDLRSSVACAAAEALAGKGPVLILSLAPWPAQDVWTVRDGGRTLSDLLYLWQTGNGSLALYLDGTVRTRGAFSYIPAVRDPEDLQELSREEWAAFLKQMAGECGYAGVVLDISQALPAAWNILSCCRRKLLISGEGELSERRVRLFRESRTAEEITAEGDIRYVTCAEDTGLSGLRELAEEVLSAEAGHVSDEGPAFY